MFIHTHTHTHTHTYIYIYHHVALLAQISLTLSRHPFLSSVALGRFSRLHPILAQSCCIQVLTGRPTCSRPCEGIHRSISLMSSSILLKQCPVYLVRLTWIVFMIGGRRPYSCCFIGCCLQQLFNIAHSILF